MNHIDKLNAAYEAGWVEAACWAKRDDLMADIESAAYIADREAHLDSIRAGLSQPEPTLKWCDKCGEGVTDFCRAKGDFKCELPKAGAAQPEPVEPQPRLKVRLRAFPESNGKQNWTALLVREQHWNGLVGNCGGITIAYGELWNRVAYAAERAKFLIGERDTEPSILDYGDDIKTPADWNGEIDGGRMAAAKGGAL